jgi:hypothetical protein
MNLLLFAMFEVLTVDYNKSQFKAKLILLEILQEINVSRCFMLISIHKLKQNMLFSYYSIKNIGGFKVTKSKFFIFNSKDIFKFWKNTTFHR